MENFQDYFCSLCKEPLDESPRACCDKRICGACYSELSCVNATCPVPSCGEFVTNKEEHFQLDRCAAKQMRKRTHVCRACGGSVVLDKLREHHKVCKLPEEEEMEAGMQEEQQPAEQLVIALPAEPIRTCQYRPFGCLFQGTVRELQAHVQVPTTTECMLAQMLSNAFVYAEDQERAALRILMPGTK